VKLISNISYFRYFKLVELCLGCKLIYIRLRFIICKVTIGECNFRLLDWRPDKLPDERHVSEKTVVLKNLFDPAEFDVSITSISLVIMMLF